MSSPTQDDSSHTGHSASPFDHSERPAAALMDVPTTSAAAAPGEGDAQAGVRRVIVDGNPVQLDALGPVVVNTDGTISRINNWHEMTEMEQQKTLKVIGKRNQARLAKLSAAACASDESGVVQA
eukprot:TRINITY_DN13626_c0_g1_i1.p1 TRINITY_DN13626_c0_g1~~TRINITY_DN13626_c0_g1_i1.p1  ORF type:complete len:124 (+),score=23.94 TRINITY_DN13626_c0_g1_i1:119-490(+)